MRWTMIYDEEFSLSLSLSLSLPLQAIMMCLIGYGIPTTRTQKSNGTERNRTKKNNSSNTSSAQLLLHAYHTAEIYAQRFRAKAVGTGGRLSTDQNNAPGDIEATRAKAQVRVPTQVQAVRQTVRYPHHLSSLSPLPPPTCGVELFAENSHPETPWITSVYCMDTGILVCDTHCADYGRGLCCLRVAQERTIEASEAVTTRKTDEDGYVAS